MRPTDVPGWTLFRLYNGLVALFGLALAAGALTAYALYRNEAINNFPSVILIVTAILGFACLFMSAVGCYCLGRSGLLMYTFVMSVTLLVQIVMGVMTMSQEATASSLFWFDLRQRLGFSASILQWAAVGMEAFALLMSAHLVFQTRHQGPRPIQDRMHPTGFGDRPPLGRAPMAARMYPEPTGFTPEYVDIDVSSASNVEQRPGLASAPPPVEFEFIETDPEFAHHHPHRYSSSASASSIEETSSSLESGSMGSLGVSEIPEIPPRLGLIQRQSLITPYPSYAVTLEREEKEQQQQQQQQQQRSGGSGLKWETSPSMTPQRLPVPVLHSGQALGEGEMEDIERGRRPDSMVPMTSPYPPSRYPQHRSVFQLGSNEDEKVREEAGVEEDAALTRRQIQFMRKHHGDLLDHLRQ